MSASADHQDPQQLQLSDGEGQDDSFRPRKNKVIITLSGKQCPEALPAVMRLLSVDDAAELTDIGQFVVRDRFLATALLTVSDHPAAQTVKDILYHAQAERERDPSFQVQFSYPPFASHPSASSLVSLPPSTEEVILTVYSPGSIPTDSLAALTSVVHSHQGRIFSIDRLTDAEAPFMALRFRIAAQFNPTLESPIEEMKKALFDVGRLQPNCDLAVQSANVMRNAKRIVVFDLSWTLVQCDSINAVLTAAGVSPPDELQQQFNDGQLSRSDWLLARVKALAGIEAHPIYEKVVENLEYTNGAVELVKGLKRLGCRLAIVTSGCKVLSETAKGHLGLDYAFGNELEVDSTGTFTGEITDPFVDADRKAELVQMLAMQERVGTEQVVAVGDGPVSAEMLASAGMSITFDQPGSTNLNSSGIISSRSLESVLYLLGITV